jgi:alkylation response protein AidB-like acyl-CoA dehydrogenase
MDFKLGEREEALRKEIRQFAQRELPRGWFTLLNLEEESRDEDWELSLAVAKKLAQKGWLVMAWPREYGGSGASYWEQLVYGEESGYWGMPGVSMGISGVAWVGPSLMSFGNEEQRKKYLPMIASGEPDGVWCTGYSEPNAGSDFASIQTRAIGEGDEYVINGQKVWTSCAHRARWCWLAARTDPAAPKKHQGISILIVDMKSPGITVNPLLNYYGEHIFNEVFFDNVRVPASNLVGEENKGWYHLMQSLASERHSIGPALYGSARRLLDELFSYARETRCDGKPLGRNPLVRYMLADVTAEAEMLRLFNYQLAWELTQGIVPVYGSSRNKAFGDRLLERLGIIGTRIMGAYSQVDPYSKWAKLRGIIQREYLLFPGLSIAAGTDEIERNIIGQFKLGLPRSY